MHLDSFCTPTGPDSQVPTSQFMALKSGDSNLEAFRFCSSGGERDVQSDAEETTGIQTKHMV